PVLGVSRAVSAGVFRIRRDVARLAGPVIVPGDDAKILAGKDDVGVVGLRDDVPRLAAADVVPETRPDPAVPEAVARPLRGPQILLGTRDVVGIPIVRRDVVALPDRRSAREPAFAAIDADGGAAVV